jgi:hypothetical protein
LPQTLVGRASLENLCTVQWHDSTLPVRVLTLGAVSADAPLRIVRGGVHGIERIGAQIVLGFHRDAAGALRWDRTLGDILER